MALDVKTLKDSFPHHLKSTATQALVDKINAIATNPEEADLFSRGIVSYANVLKEGRFHVEDYVSAVIYVSHKLLGCTNQQAWKNTFPKRHLNLVAHGADEKKISAYVASYHGGKLVTLILEQVMVPTWILNADKFQAAVQVQFELMSDPDVSPKVRTEAANSLLTHLRKPEVKKMEIDLGVRENAGMDELRNAMTELAETQRDLISKGTSTQKIAHQSLFMKQVGEAIEAEVVRGSSVS